MRRKRKRLPAALFDTVLACRQFGVAVGRLVSSAQRVCLRVWFEVRCGPVGGDSGDQGFWVVLDTVKAPTSARSSGVVGKDGGRALCRVRISVAAMGYCSVGIFLVVSH